MSVDRFLSQQEAFLASVSSNAKQVRKRAQWTERGSYYLRTRGGMAKDALIVVDTDVQRMAFNFIAQSKPAVAAAINDHFVPVAERAFREWPVKTGLSKSLLALTFSVNADSFSANLVNRAPYAWYIRDRRESEMGQAVTDLISDPMADAADRAVGAMKAKRPPKPRRGKNGEVANALVFNPGEAVADKMARDILGDLGD